MVSFRTPEMDKIYADYQKTDKFKNACAICEETLIKQFKHWKIIKNNFPYDQIAEVHHMLVPIRHVSGNNLNGSELDELKEIKKDFVDKEYSHILETTTKYKSVPDHFHLHLILTK